MKNSPMVSAVIPSRGRAELVVRAVRTALKQSYSNLEVIVVVDGPDAETTFALSNIGDPRLRVMTLPQSVGGASARNAGVAGALGEWIAFLDDDDEWLPGKIQSQLALAATSRCAEPIVSCRFVARTNTAQHIWPARLPDTDESIADYLLVRKGVQRTEGFVQTSTILSRRSLLMRIPFTDGLRRHQDWDWVLRATKESEVHVMFCPEALVVWDIQSENSISRKSDYRFSLDWIRRMKPVISKRAYASFLTSHVAWQAAAQRAWPAFFPLLIEAVTCGSVRTGDLARYAGLWFTPQTFRKWAQRQISHSR